MCEGKSVYLWVVQLIGIIGIVVLCLWLSLRPKSPSYSVVFISIEQPSTSNENGTIFFALEIENPNKDSSIYYDDTILSFLYGQEEEDVGETSIGSFHQGSVNTRVVSDTVSAKPRPFKTLLNAISNATAELKVALTTRYRFKTLGMKSKSHGLHLKGILPIDSNGKLSRKKKKYPLSLFGVNPSQNSPLTNNLSEITAPDVLWEARFLLTGVWQLVSAIGELEPAKQQRKQRIPGCTDTVKLQLMSLGDYSDER
ncbi:Protein NDR1, partial [Mucuna pruriens]